MAKGKNGNKQPELNLDGLNLKAMPVEAGKLQQVKELGSLETPKSVFGRQLAERLLKDLNRGEAVNVASQKEADRERIAKAILRDLNAVGNERMMRAKCVDRGTELYFYFEKKEAKKQAESGPELPLPQAKKSA